MYKLFRPVLFVCGIVAWVMAGFLLIPALYSLYCGDTEYNAFFIASGIVAGCGVVMMAPGYAPPFALNARQLYLLTGLSWLSLSFFSAAPFMLVSHPMSLADAVFEAVSGITTTGSTVLTHLAQTPPSILLWRSMLQWIGGFGVIGMAITILPFLRVGGMRLFQTESSDWSDKSMPRFQAMARGLLVVYLGLTVLCTGSYWLAGMTPFDAINHAMATVSTGGFATDDSSMGRFSLDILWISTFFMILGGLPFTLYIRFLHSRRLASLKDEQVVAFLVIVVGLVIALTLQRMTVSDESFFSILTHNAFNIVSVITTTGFASQDYTQWGMFAIAMFFFVTFMGACSGSTSGGMKIFRFQLSWLFLREQMQKLVHPNGVFSARYNGKPVTDDIMGSAVAFSFLFFLVLTITTFLLVLIGLDFVTALTGAATALTNVGPGLGDVIGPAGNFATVPDSGKWLLSFAMILGRLEMLTLMVLFTPIFWRG